MTELVTSSTNPMVTNPMVTNPMVEGESKDVEVGNNSIIKDTLQERKTAPPFGTKLWFAHVWVMYGTPMIVGLLIGWIIHLQQELSLCVNPVSVVHDAKNANPTSFYKAAAIQMEHLPVVSVASPTWSDNVDRYGALIDEAKSKTPGIEMVVFPEGANGWFPNNQLASGANARPQLKEYFSDTIPMVQNGFPIYNPCVARTSGQLWTLSCLARSKNIVLVANLIEYRDCTIAGTYEWGDPPCPVADRMYLFNSLVVLGKNGQLIAKYNKRHISGTLYQIDEPTPARTPAVFDITFNSGDTVKFGMIICQDITYTDVVAEYRSLNVRDIIFSTHFSNGLPMWNMGALFQGWSKYYNVNLIVANGLQGVASQGGGIYASGKLIDYFFNLNSIAADKVTSGSLPVLPLQTNGEHGTVDSKLDSSTPRTPSTPYNAQKAYATKLFKNFNLGANAVELDVSTIGTKTAVVKSLPMNNPFTGQLEFTNDFQCEFTYNILPATPSVRSKYFLIAQQIPLSGTVSNQCEGTAFFQCGVYLCPNYPNCYYDSTTNSGSQFVVSELFSSFRLLARGMPIYKTAMFGQVVSASGNALEPLSTSGGSWDAESSTDKTIFNIKSSDSGYLAQALSTIGITASSIFEQVCWDNNPPHNSSRPLFMF
jgi:predicted amidohydrolase